MRRWPKILYVLAAPSQLFIRLDLHQKMFMKFFHTSLFLLFQILTAFGQDWRGEWVGTLTQDGNPDEFIYTITLDQQGEKVFGTATSKSATGESDAKFEIGGIYYRVESVGS